VELAERDDHRPYLAVAWRALGAAARMRGELEEARRLLNDALEIFEGGKMAWQIGRTCCELGDLELARGSTEQAEAYFEAAAEAFKRIGAEPFLKQARAELERIRVSD
jgi:tetratricopeptide (TPR) repeat protein